MIELGIIALIVGVALLVFLDRKKPKTQDHPQAAAD
jgi:hypothetical protein